MSLPKSWLLAEPSSASSRASRRIELLGLEDVDAHRPVTPAGLTRESPDRSSGFSWKPIHAALTRRVSKTAETADCPRPAAPSHRADRQRGASLWTCSAHHVDGSPSGRCDRPDRISTNLRALSLERVDVLVDRVRRTLDTTFRCPWWCGGRTLMNCSSRRGRKFQPKRMCSSSERAWYCVKT